MNDDRIHAYLTFYRDDLLGNVIPFWLKNAPDRQHGGVHSCLDRDGSVYSTDKAVWIQGRFAWMCAKLYNAVEARPEWLELSRQSLEFLDRHAFDGDGRMYFLLTGDGQPLRKRRYLFSETFAIIAFAEYAKASGDGRAAERAMEIFRLLMRYHTTPGLCEPKVNPDTRPMKGLAMPMILLATIQVLRQVSDDPLLRETVDRSLWEVETHFLKPEFEVLLETVGPGGEFLDTPDGRSINPGHAIETAWFILEEGRHRSDDHLIRLGLKILDWSLKAGWDEEHGGIVYFRDVKNLPCPQYEHDMKLWWPHNEAIYATLLAHHLTGEARYEDWHRRLHDWSFGHFADHAHGEWFGYLHRDGTVANRLKGNLWKGPFHLPRMLLYCWKLLEEMQPAAR